MRLHELVVQRPDWGGIEVAADEQFTYVICRMLYTHRLHVIRKGPGITVATYAWCFKKLPLAVAAVGVWDPETQNEPLWWHKRAGETRYAPRQHEQAEYNLPRCIHGSYLHQPSCDIDPFCHEVPRQGSP
jgi:hypothetical protein